MVFYAAVVVDVVLGIDPAKLRRTRGEADVDAMRLAHLHSHYNSRYACTECAHVKVVEIELLKDF